MSEQKLNLKNEDLVVRELHGAGFITKSLVRVEKVEKNIFYIEGADGYYADDSVYAFSLENGESINNFTPGFFSKIIRKATEEDKENLEHH